MKTTKFLFVIVAIVLTKHAVAQFSDDFSDGDFTTNPTWSGMTQKFSVVSGKLKLSAPALPETAFLVTPSNAVHNASWEFSLQMDFAPSSTNYAKVYLISDQENIQSPLNGYFIKIGNTARDVCLYRQSGTTETKIIDGKDDLVNQTTVRIKTKVTRSEAGEWALFTDIGQTGTYAEEGKAIDITHTVSSCFGVSCVYTATRSDKFWFDDFVVTGGIVPDTTPPAVVSLTAITSKQLRIVFSEPIRPPSGDSFLLITKGTPSFTTFLSDARTMILDFASPMINGVTYLLRVEGIKDIVGNRLQTIELDCMFFETVLSNNKDIIFTELFPDPSPQIGLPNAEFAEIYNRSQHPFNLNGWKITDGSSTGTFPSQIILPGEYLIITSTSSASLFNSFGRVIGLANFPTLNNNGDTFVLRNSNNKTIDSVSYTIDWYHDHDKQQGGWTLELIDITNLCGEEDNWTASEDKSGGTPGRKNSVFANKPDITPPLLVSAFPQTKQSIILTFNEKLDKRSLQLGNFSLYSGEITKATFGDKTLRTIVLETSSQFELRKLYTVEAKDISDCNLNSSALLSRSFALPENSDSLDVVINEILFNPLPFGADFVEIINKSKKYINLKSWKTANYNNGVIQNILTLFVDDVMLAPDSIIAMSANPTIIKSHYPRSGNSIYKCSLPSLPDDSGSLAIINESGTIVDQVTYSKKWHSPFIKNEDGVSLERLSTTGASNDSGNWSSASSVSGFATPAKRNSHERIYEGIDQNNIAVLPEIFSPGDAHNDFVQINYQFDNRPVANVRVYDVNGRLLKTLLQNETLASTGSLRWDGDRDDGVKARMGYYFIWFEVFDNSGKVQIFRKRVIVSSR